MTQDPKNLLIISPEPWGSSKVSKHHYALAFAELDYQVYFLSVGTGIPNVKTEVCPDHKNIRLVVFSIPKLFNWLRFHGRKTYNFLLRTKVYVWLKDFPRFNLLISFDCNGVFTQLSNFRAERTIFFPVDRVKERFVREYNGFDKLISISPVILESFPHVKNKILINHGLSPDFLAAASQEDNFYFENEVKKIAYVGNLLIGPILDKPVLKAIISQNRNCKFHFFGAFDPETNNLGSDISVETMDFIDFIKVADNCVLHGTVASNILANELENMDAFLICYDYRFDKNKCSNAHKILEYLALGKPIISTRISMYDNLNLFPMLDTFDNKAFPEFFKQQLVNWKNINIKEAYTKRKEFAKRNSYAEHINKIKV